MLNLAGRGSGPVPMPPYAETLETIVARCRDLDGLEAGVGDDLLPRLGERGWGDPPFKLIETMSCDRQGPRRLQRLRFRALS